MDTHSTLDSAGVEHYDPFTRVVVAGRSWTRSQPIEALQPVVYSGQSVPADGEVLSQSREVVDHRQVLDHYDTRQHEVTERVAAGTEEYVCGQRDLGNGYFEDRTCTRTVYEDRSHTESEQVPVYRDEPIYGTVYRYRTWEWHPDTTLVAQTHDDAAPEWPRAPAATRTRRPAERRETVEVELRGAGRGFSIPVPLEQYRRLLVGDTIRIVVDDNGVVRHVLPVWRGAAAPAPTPPPDSAAAASADTSHPAPPTRPATRKHTRRRQHR